MQERSEALWVCLIQVVGFKRQNTTDGHILLNLPIRLAHSRRLEIPSEQREGGAANPMCELTSLAEKLVDDFYATDDRPVACFGEAEDGLKEQLKALVPEDQWNLLFLWEAQTVEAGGQELRRFAGFMARLLSGVDAS